MTQTITRMNVVETDTVEAFAARQLKAVGIMSNPYFLQLQDGTMSRKAFAHSQTQFYFAVAFYSRPMGILLARMNDLVARMNILRNVLDEHGGLNAARSHQNTFRQFLLSLGEQITPQTVATPALHSFNSVLTAVCSFEEIEIGIATLGVIELAFAEISTKIGQAAVARGFVSEKELVHYTVHRELDVKHADDFFVLVEESWRDPARRIHVERGLALGAHIFDRLYSDLLILGEQSQ